ncbi:hypothetical protein IEQ34_016766 [Dendrobium chrysotoxum]|uniref:Uncharacterized protein n=1 Tax=Dendrobium chrysotoxum TaxID=161865 RepID=A0AAV7GF54_DENCH|nr:hypothetical protein IEQ34_016766 [Dendrobium chrysotoxum]
MGEKPCRSFELSSPSKHKKPPGSLVLHRTLVSRPLRTTSGLSNGGNSLKGLAGYGYTHLNWLLTRLLMQSSCFRYSQPALADSCPTSSARRSHPPSPSRSGSDEQHTHKR